MTSPDDGPVDGSRDDPAAGAPGGSAGSGSPFDPSFDEDAAWRLIIENYGERAQLGSTSVDRAPGGPVPPPTRDRVEPGVPRDPVDPAERLAPGEPVERVAPSEPAEPVEPVEPVDRGVFDRAYLDALDADARNPDGRGPDEHYGRRRTDDHDHFVPPEPPPVPKGTPARRIAWAGLFTPPLLMILAVVLGWAIPTWLSMMLVAGFVGGFVFLVATMPRDGGDGWDDGAVV